MSRDVKDKTQLTFFTALSAFSPEAVCPGPTVLPRPWPAPGPGRCLTSHCAPRGIWYRPHLGRTMNAVNESNESLKPNFHHGLHRCSLPKNLILKISTTHWISPLLFQEAAESEKDTTPAVQNVPTYSSNQHTLLRDSTDMYWAPTMCQAGFPGGSDSKESACNARDQGLVPG